MSGKKDMVACVIVSAVVLYAFYALIAFESQRIYVSTGTVSSTTRSDNHLGGVLTRIRFIATDFSIIAYGNYDHLQVGHQYTFTYRMDFSDIAVVESVVEVK